MVIMNFIGVLTLTSPCPMNRKDPIGEIMR